MSGPRDGSDDGSGWQEPSHLGGGAEGPAPAGWQPPGWDLPSVQPERPAHPAPATGGLTPVQQWGLPLGWAPSDGTGPQDAVLDELVRSAPVRPSRAHRPAGVLRGREGGLELVAFEIVFPDRNRLVPQWAVTAAPVLGAVPAFRLAPARFWKHRIGGLVQLPSSSPEFDRRWVLLAGEDTPALRGLVDDRQVQQLLLGSDDGDELWSAAGSVAAVRPDGLVPELIAHHARILAAVVRALGAGG